MRIDLVSPKCCCCGRTEHYSEDMPGDWITLDEFDSILQVFIDENGELHRRVMAYKHSDTIPVPENGKVFCMGCFTSEFSDLAHLESFRRMILW